MWYWYKKNYSEWNRKENPEINPNTRIQLGFDKSIKK